MTSSYPREATIGQHQPAVMSSSRGRAIARCAAGVALVCGLGHILLLLTHGYGHLGMATAAMTVLAAGCLVCARHLWVAPGVRPWLLLAAMNAVMLVLHSAAMTTSLNGSSGHAVHHGYSVVEQSGVLGAQAEHPHADLLVAVLTALAMVQIVCATVMLAWYRRVVAEHHFGRPGIGRTP
jgi:hypothetical protein